MSTTFETNSFIASAAVFVATQLDSTYARIAIVIFGVALLTFGELLYSAAEIPVSARLSPDGSIGLYQGIFLIGKDTIDMAGPLLAAFFCVSLGPPGWAILAALYVVFSIFAPRIVRGRTRPGAIRNLVRRPCL